VLCNPINSVNPDSKPSEKGEFTLKTDVVGIPVGGTGHSDNREMHLYHGRANAIRPYNHCILSSLKSGNPLNP